MSEKNAVTEWLTSQIFDKKQNIAKCEKEIEYFKKELEVYRGELWDLEQAAVKLVFYKDIKDTVEN